MNMNMNKPNDKITVEHLQNKHEHFTAKAKDLNDRLTTNHVEKELATSYKSVLEKERNNQDLNEQDEQVVRTMQNNLLEKVSNYETNPFDRPIDREISQVNSYLAEVNQEIQSDLSSLDKTNRIIKLAEESLSIAKGKSAKLANSIEGKDEIQFSNLEINNKRKTPTSDFVDSLPQDYSPFDDMGVD